jgi:hypothetical protein
MKLLKRCSGMVSVTGAVAIGFPLGLTLAACGTAFTQGGSSGGKDGGGSDVGSSGDGPVSNDGGCADCRDATSDSTTTDALADVKTGDVVVSEGSAGEASAGDAGPLCHGAFGTPTLVLAHTAAYYVDSFTLNSDEVDAFVTLFPVDSTREERTVFEMQRAKPADVFVLDTSKPVILTTTGSTPGAFDVALSANAQTLYFAHRQDDDAGLLGIDVYEAQRLSGTFNGGTAFGPGIDDPTTTQFHPHPGGPDLYFTVAPLVSGALGQRDLYVAPLAGGARAPIAELNSATTQEANPVPSGDELEIFFASDRANPGSFNQIYDATRSSPGLVFGQPSLVSLALANPSSNVTPQYLTPDRCRLYMLVDQEDVYVAQRAP